MDFILLFCSKGLWMFATIKFYIDMKWRTLILIPYTNSYKEEFAVSRNISG